MAGRRFAGLMTLALGACAPAQPFAADDPSDPAQPTAALSYTSPFAGQPGFAVVQPRPWRETNDLVRRLGGPAGHLREAPDADAGKARP